MDQPQQTLDTRRLTEAVAVGGQIRPEDMAKIAALGFVKVVNNRPDQEVPPEHRSEEMARAARAAGLDYVYLPYEPGPPDERMVEAFAEATADASAGAPVFAFCRSGNRSTVLWAMTQAGKRDPAEILHVAAGAGYDLTGHRPALADRARTRR